MTDSIQELRSIKVNLDHLVKHLNHIQIVTKNGEYDEYNGQSECEQFIRESLGIYNRRLYPDHEA